MFEFFGKVIEEFGALGAVMLIIGALIYYLIKQSDKKTEKSMTELSDNITSALTKQNDVLVNTLSTNSMTMQQNMAKLLETSMNMHDQYKNEEHAASMKHRLDISDKIQIMLYEIMNFYHAKRSGIMEFHNNTNNLNGLSFLWYDLSYESLQRNIRPISGLCKNQQLSILSPVMSDVISNDGIVLYRSSDIDSLAKRSPVLYDHLTNKIKVSNVIYAGLYDLHNNLIGLLFLEYDDDYIYPESIIDFHDIKERASGMSQLLDFKKL